MRRTHTHQRDRERERESGSEWYVKNSSGIGRIVVARAPSTQLYTMGKFKDSSFKHPVAQMAQTIHTIFKKFSEQWANTTEHSTHTHLHIVCIRINSICPSYFTLSFSIEWSYEKAKEQARTDSNCMHCRWWWCWFAYFSANEPNVINCSPYAMYLAQKRIIIFIDMLLFHLLAWFYFSSFSSIPHVHFLFHLCVLFLLPFLRCA